MDTYGTLAPASLSLFSPALTPDLLRSDALGSLSDLLRGPSEPMRRLWTQLARVAPHFRVALLTGEPDCGQDAVAQAFHNLSPFRAGPLVILVCAAEERRLRQPKRLLEEIEGGVLVLSGVEELSEDGQLHLLRFLRLQRLRSCGVVASSTRDLRSLSAGGGFSGELAAQLSAFCVAVPSLRDRSADVPMLLDLAMHRLAAETNTPSRCVSESFRTTAQNFTWPGNLRQIEAVARHMLEEGFPDRLEANHLIAALSAAEATAEVTQASPARMVPLEKVMREHTRCVLLACGGNKLRASEILGISRSTLYRMLEGGEGAALGSVARGSDASFC